MAVHQRVVAVVLAACASLATGGASAAPLEESALAREARDDLLHGHPDAALLLFEANATESKTTVDRRTWVAAEALALSQTLAALGRYPEARKVLAPHLQGKKPDADLVLAAAAVERQIGTGPARLQLLARAGAQAPKDVRLHVALGEQLLELGKAVEARKILDPIADRFEAGEFKDTAELVAVARSLALDGYVKDANRVFGEAEQAASDDAEKVAVQLPWGQLFISKYNYRDGDACLQKVLAIDPNHAEALLGMARIDLVSDHAVAKARERVEAVLARNPQHLDALVLRAEIALEDEDYAAARQVLGRALQQRPDFPEALRVLGATCKLADDEPCFASAEKRARQINPDDGRFYFVAATWLEQAHRYREVLELLGKALQRDPDLWQAHAALGMGYARVADDKKAEKELQTAFDGDPYDVRTANQLSILYDNVLKQMTLLPGRAVDLRVHKKDRIAFERTMLPFLQESYDSLVKRYGFAPQAPLQVEIFPETEQFSVRTVGLPHLGAHAVCFGHLITSRSPSEKPFNWKMVLYHELSHVFHIQATDGRVPRWLTEGLAMMESAWADPRWKLGMDRRAYDRRKAGELAQLAHFNLAFTQAQSLQEIVDAYYQAMLLVEFLNDRFGFPKLRELVAAHRSGKDTATLVTQVLGVAPAAIDAEFDAWLGTKLARYDKDFRPTPDILARELGLPKPGAQAELPPLPDKAPVRAQLAQAVQLLRMGQIQPALPILRQLVSAPLAPQAPPTVPRDVCAARFLWMEMAVKLGDRAAQKDMATALVAQPACDGVRQRIVLAGVLKAEGNLTGSIAQLRAAQQLDPSDPAPVHLLAQTLLQTGQLAEARAAARTNAELDANDPAPAALLGKLAWEAWPTANPEAQKELAHDLALAARSLEETDPGGRAAVLFEARQAVAQGRPATGLAAYRMAAERAKTPAERAEAWCELAGAADKAGARADRDEAARHCQSETPPAPAKPAGLPLQPTQTHP